MKNYQSLIAVKSEKDKGSFVYDAIAEYKLSEMFHWAIEGDHYARKRNTAISRYQKLLYTVSGKAIPDNWTANHKCASSFFNRFIVQENQYLLGNGVMFGEMSTKDALGGHSFDIQLQKLGLSALTCGVSYGFWNFNHLEVFKATEFAPLLDVEDGLLKGGIRFWQVSAKSPIRATLYELDGYTEYIKSASGKISVYKPKRDYKQLTIESVADGVEVMNNGNYKGFPIIPLWANPNHESELVGIKGQIDAYDLIKSGFANDLDDASMIYWTLENAGGMEDIDLAKFIERLKTVKAVALSDEVKAESHTIDVPYQSREAYLERLENDLYNDAMALNVNRISAGNITATAINAAYEPLNNKCDQFEYCICEFIASLLDVAGIPDDYPTFTRSKIMNVQEETAIVLSAAEYLDRETVIKHLPFLTPEEVGALLEKEGNS